jgi:hypothetical protein
MSKFLNLRKGHILSETQFYVVESVSGDKVNLKSQDGQLITVPDKYVEKCLISAHDFSKVEKLSRTELVKKVLEASNMAITVNFNKKVDEKAIISGLDDLYPNAGKMVSKADYTKKVKASIKSLLEGEERTMIGYHQSQTDDFGRIQFADMEVTSGHNQRQIDPRTVNWAIINNVKYEVK